MRSSTVIRSQFNRFVQKPDVFDIDQSVMPIAFSRTVMDIDPVIATGDLVFVHCSMKDRGIVARSTINSIVAGVAGQRVVVQLLQRGGGVRCIVRVQLGVAAWVVG